MYALLFVASRSALALPMKIKLRATETTIVAIMKNHGKRWAAVLTIFARERKISAMPFVKNRKPLRSSACGVKTIVFSVIVVGFLFREVPVSCLKEAAIQASLEDTLIPLVYRGDAHAVDRYRCKVEALLDFVEIVGVWYPMEVYFPFH